MNQTLQQTLWCKATLQYPTVNQLPLESVGDMLNKASNLATTANFQWSYIDKPADGSIFLVYMQNGAPPAPDGFMYMDGEQPYNMNVGGKIIEIWEHKYGFIPGQEQVTTRSRRRFRLAGKNPNDVASSLWLLFYSRTGEDTRVAANPMQARPQPMRKYPLPTISTKPFNLFQAVTGGAQMPSHQQQMQQQYQVQHLQQLQAQQAQAAAALQAQQMGGTPRHGSQAAQQRQSFTPQQTATPGAYPHSATSTSTVPQKRPYGGQQGPTPAQLPPDVLARMQRGELINDSVLDDTPVDLNDSISPIDVSRSRFIRHQEWMEELFSAYPISRIIPPSMFSEDITEDKMREQIAKETKEIEELTALHETGLAAFKNPTGIAGRVTIGLQKLADREANLDAEALASIEQMVGLETIIWTDGSKISIPSV